MKHAMDNSQLALITWLRRMLPYHLPIVSSDMCSMSHTS